MKIEPIDTMVNMAKDFVQKLINPSLEEAGLLMAENIRHWRVKNQIKIVLKAEKYLRDNSITTMKVSLKTLAPFLEYSSLEEDESLQDKWAALLAHTVADGSKVNTTLYSYILSQLSKEDADVFEYLYEISYVSDALENTSPKTEIIEIHNGKISHLLNPSKGFPQYRNFDNFTLILDNLIRLRLITEIQTTGDGLSAIMISNLGHNFLKLCKFKN